MTIEFDYELDYEGRIINCYVLAEASVYVEKNYGADADGNRGEPRLFIEDTTVKIEDSRGNNITEKLRNKSQSLIDCFIEVAEEKLLEAYYE